MKPAESRDDPPPLASSREWLQLTGCGVALVLLGVVWTFWA